MQDPPFNFLFGQCSRECWTLCHRSRKIAQNISTFRFLSYCVCVCMCVWVFACICVSMGVCACVSVCMCVCICAFMFVCMCVCVCGCMCVCVCDILFFPFFSSSQFTFNLFPFLSISVSSLFPLFLLLSSYSVIPLSLSTFLSPLFSLVHFSFQGIIVLLRGI